VQYLWILDAKVRCLKVEEVKETLDCLRQGAALGHRKDGIKHTINVRLKDTL
jgi:protein involved in temperature-dependent protein secretion